MKPIPQPNPVVAAGKARFGNALPLALIAGPCVLESRAHAFDMAGALKEIAARCGIGLVYKTSFDKANRTSAKSARGLGLDKALAIFAELREKLGVPVLTDVHEPDQCAASRRGRRYSADPGLPLPADRPAGRRRQDRPRRQREEGAIPGAVGHGQCGGQDHRRRQSPTCWSPSAASRSATTRWSPTCARCRCSPSIGAPVIFDATHSVQQPGGQGTSSGGEREFVPVLARAAVAVGVAGVFIETHQDPDRAPSDGPNMMPLKEMEPLLERLMEFDALAKARPEHSAKAAVRTAAKA